jgi:hypothetical protein
VLLAGMASSTAMRRTAADVGDYHERVQKAFKDVPYVIGDWIGESTSVPTRAQNLLKPNAILSRRYTDSRTGHVVQLLLVHCRDARNLKGHYPPVCYPSQGWSMQKQTLKQIDLPVRHAKEAVEVMRYDFSRDEGLGQQRLRVLNLMVLPNGKFDTGMDGVNSVAENHRYWPLGAAELQIIVDPAISRKRRDQVFKNFFEAVAPALQTVRAGRTQEDSGGSDEPAPTGSE